MRIIAAVLILASIVAAQERPGAQPDQATQLRQLISGQRSGNSQTDEVSKAADDLLWFTRLGDVAHVDKWEIASSKPIRMANSTGQGAGNPLIIYAYTFVPKKLGANQKAPLLIFVHGGVHANFDSPSYSHVIRELVEQGYIVAAPDYRGSTGYGRAYYDQIDYGGAEIDDTHDVRNWAVQNLPNVDPQRVGIMGWSHGGYHTLLNIVRWPQDYKVAYAGCPVSDLVMRMGYKGPGYEAIYSEFIGKSAADNPMEYRKRSPVFYADQYKTPLLIHTNTNDEDVNVMEVQHLIEALKAAGNKQFEYKIYENAPGGHHFNRIDTALAKQSRQEIYAFLAKYLKP